MPGKEGGKAKPLKKAKGKTVDLDEDDLAFKAKQKEDAAKLKALKEQAAGKGSSTLRAAPTNDALERRRSAPRVQPVIALTRSALPSCGSTSPRSRDRRIRRGHEEERKEVTRDEI